MANKVLLQQGAYSKFTLTNQAQSTGLIYNYLTTIMSNADKTTMENIKELYDAWNYFIEQECPDEKDTWQLDLKVTKTTTTSKLQDDGTIDYSEWLEKDINETVASVASRIMQAKKDLIKVSKEIYDGTMKPKNGK